MTEKSNGRPAIEPIEEKTRESTLVSPFPFCYSDPDPIGGGFGYSSVITVQQADVYINYPISAIDFQSIIEDVNRQDGDIIYIENDIVIDLSGLEDQIEVSKAITISSGKDVSTGALIFSDDFGYSGESGNPDSAPFFRVLVDGVRFTGLRFKGPTIDVEHVRIEAGGEPKVKSAILIAPWHSDPNYNVEANYLEVDNCEFFGFPSEAISIGRGYNRGSFEGNKIHHNYFHENRQWGLGYAVLIQYGYAEIYANKFLSNRHDIAGSGKVGTGYEAYCNTILSGGISHNFDMHAEGDDDQSVNAGKFVFIHHNDFRDIGGTARLGGNDFNIMFRGRPDVQCRIENNKFAHETHAGAIHQKNQFCGYGNILVWNNIFHEHQYKGVYVHHDWNHFKASNFIELESNNEDIIEPATVFACGLWSHRQIYYDFGDYDGDGKTDIFKYERVGPYPATIYTIPLDATGGFNTAWTPILTTNYDHDDLHFGFYNADSKTDVLVKDGNSIYISDGVNSAWSYMLYTGYPISSMKFGDFDANGVLDLLLFTGTSWYVSYNCNSSWQYINYSTYSPNTMALGTFDYNNNTDVFTATGSQWKVSYGAASAWNLFKNDPAVFDNIQVGDFNHDDRSDVIRSDRYVSRYGYYSWEKCDISNFPIATFPYGNF